MIYAIKQSFEIISFPNNAVEVIASCARISHTKSTFESKDISDPEDFVRKLICWGHMSPFEHISAQVKITTNRAIANELVRHRHCAFTQESTRYCNYYDALTLIKPLWVEPGEGWREYVRIMDNIHMYYRNLINRGVPQEQARGVLPLDTATTLIMTANLREWISVFKLRCDKASHPQMVELMTKIRDEFVKRLPWLKEALPDNS